VKSSVLGKLFCAGLLATLMFAPVRCAHAQAAVATKPVSSQSSAAQADSSLTSAVEFDESKQYKESPTVQKLGKLLGMNPEQSAIAFEVTNFTILLFLLGTLLVKMLPKTFRARNTAIQKDLVDARTATEQASVRLSGVEARLGKLDDEIAAIRAQAEKASALDEQRIAASLEEEKLKILAAADQEIAAATTSARRDLQKFAAELAIEQAARKLTISAETDRLLVQNFARRLGADDSKEGQN
jgi:F-type H+-transporting ATPase subunit b